MKKLIIILCATLIFSGSTFAQRIGAISGQMGIAIPAGDFAELFNAGIGGTGTIFYYIRPNVSLNVTAGHFKWSETHQLIFLGNPVEVDVSTSLTPILAGARYYFEIIRITPYIGADIGIFVRDEEFKSKDETVMNSWSDSGTQVGFGFGGGVLYHIGRLIAVDANITYTTINSSGGSIDFTTIAAGIRVGF